MFSRCVAVAVVVMIAIVSLKVVERNNQPRTSPPPIFATLFDQLQYYPLHPPLLALVQVVVVVGRLVSFL